MMSPAKEEDANYESNSVAKGVFVFKKGRKVQPRNAQAQQTKRSSSTKAKRSAKGNKAKKTTKKRASIGDQDQDGADTTPYLAAWDKASKVFAQLQQQTFKEVLDGVITFAKSHSRDSGGSSDDASYSFCLPTSTIPACALLTGVNLPDHKDLFKLLTSRLRAEVPNKIL